MHGSGVPGANVRIKELVFWELKPGSAALVRPARAGAGRGLSRPGQLSSNAPLPSSRASLLRHPESVLK